MAQDARVLSSGGGGAALSAGTVLAGRFHVLRLLGRGGIGEVYEAEDLELRVRVALKTLRPEIASEEDVRERFRREVLLARRVTHLNVCRIFDVYHHRIAADAAEQHAGDILFFTMELLSGETLSSRLKQQGPFTPAEALPLVRQMVWALATAHAAGVVHRDFKAANVMLCASATGEQRAAVTDFGLARALETDDSSSLSGSIGMVGTSAYMAPEQVEGGEVGPAVDVYALGVVLYEMVTGRRPFAGANPAATALQRLREPPQPPGKHAPGLPAEWESTILRCLERDPQERFARVEDVLSALAGERVPTSRRRFRRPGWRGRASRGVLALALLAVALGVWSRTDRAPVDPGAPVTGGPPPAAVTPRRSVAVLGFKNLSGDDEKAWLSTALSEMLRTELAAGERLRTIPGENIALMKRDLALSDADALSRETLSRVRTNIGADLVVLGSYLSLGAAGGKLRLDLRVQDTTAGETISHLAETGTESGLFELVSRAGGTLRRTLGLGELAPAEIEGLRASLPTSPEAMRLYSAGLAKLRLLDARGALGLLEDAIRVEPTYPLAHAALAEAWWALGHDGKAEETAKHAFDLSSSLPVSERLWVEARYREVRREWDKAIHAYQLLWGFFPDNLDYGLRLASVQAAVGLARDALATVEAMRRTPGYRPDDPRIDLAEIEAAAALSDYPRVRAAAARAVAKGQAQGARMVVARAKFREASALQNTGELDEAEAAFEECRRIAAAAGERVDVAWALRGLALVHSRRGDLARASEVYRQSLAIFRDLGNRRGAATALNGWGWVLRQQGDLAGARRAQQEALDIFREIGDRGGAALLLNNLASLTKAEGALPAAERMYEQSLAIRRELGEKKGIAETLNSLARLQWERGYLKRARASVEEALAVSRGIGQKSAEGTSLDLLARVLADEGRTAEARRSQEEALALREQLGERLAAAESRAELAQLLLDVGELEAAEREARASGEEFRAQSAVQDEARARSVLALVLAAAGRHPEAAESARQAEALARRSGNQAVKLEMAMASARVAAEAAGAAPAVLARLESVLSRARAGHRLRLAWDAQLVLGRLELKAGRESAGRARLAALEEETRAGGFARLASRAASARAAR